jgi:aspartate/methionine/tyrosine aminotransferase
MLNTPIDAKTVYTKIKEMKLKSVGLASIREINRIVLNTIEATGKEYIRMEMGIPGLNPPAIEIEGEIEALKRGVGSKYPPFDGIPQLKAEISNFVKNFMNVDIRPETCMPTVGSMQGCLMAMMVCGRRKKNKDKILFIDPGFPVNKKQVRAVGLKIDSFDVYEYRGRKLRDKLRNHLKAGDVAAIMYSNPNNPAWICFNDEELQIIGKLATEFDAVVLEDLAYFGMDFRKDYSIPGEAPFIPSVANYTDNYVLLISSSKSFSLAGQRIGMTAISNKLFDSKADGLEEYFGTSELGRAYIFGAMYALSSGVSHSNQYGLYHLLKAVNEGRYNFLEPVKVYRERAVEMKKIFLEHGFHLVYDKDIDQPLADGFYFTVGYKGISGVDLTEELLYYGVSSIALATTGSTREGIRACVSLTSKERFPLLIERLKKFDEDHRQGGFMIIDQIKQEFE